MGKDLHDYSLDTVKMFRDDAVKAGQDRERFRNEGQAYANDVVPRARGNAARLIEEANGYQAEVTQRAEGDASRFRQIQIEYAKAPAVTRERMYLDTMSGSAGTSRFRRSRRATGPVPPS